MSKKIIFLSLIFFANLVFAAKNSDNNPLDPQNFRPLNS